MAELLQHALIYSARRVRLVLKLPELDLKRVLNLGYLLQRRERCLQASCLLALGRERQADAVDEPSRFGRDARVLRGDLLIEASDLAMRRRIDRQDFLPL